MAGDPCSLLFGSMKQACENTLNLAGGGSGSRSGSGGLPNILNPGDWKVGFGGDLAHFAVRVAEVGIGIGLVLIALNALLKGSAVTVPSTVKLARSVAK